MLWIIPVLMSGTVHAQNNPLKLGVLRAHSNRVTEYFLEKDMVTVITRRHKTHYRHRVVKEITDSTIILSGRDTIRLSNIMEITDKELGADHLHIARQMSLAALGSAALFLTLNFAGTANIIYVLQFASLAFTAFAIPFAAVNAITGLLRNNKHYRIGSDWILMVVDGEVNYSIPH